MGSSHSSKTSDIRLSGQLSEAFNQFQEQIRERAYQLSLLRDPDQGSPVTTGSKPRLSCRSRFIWR